MNTMYFTIKYVHGGQFVEELNTTYAGRQYDFYNMCHFDFMSLLELHDTTKSFEKYFGKILSLSTNYLKLTWKEVISIESDNDMLVMRVLLPLCRIIEIYFEYTKSVDPLSDAVKPYEVVETRQPIKKLEVEQETNTS